MTPVANPPSSLRPVVALAASVGLFAQVAQIVMFREMMAIGRGTEVFFGVVMAAGLGWTALGSVVAGLFARRWFPRDPLPEQSLPKGSPLREGIPPQPLPKASDLREGTQEDPAAYPPEGVKPSGGNGEPSGGREKAWSYAAALFGLNGLLLIGQIALARHRSAAWGGAGELTFLEAVAVAIAATAPVAFLCGVEFVLALHAAPAERFGTLYQADAWGAVAGGLAFTFLLVGFVDPVTLGPLLTAALGLVIVGAGGRRWIPTGIFISIGIAAAVQGGHLDRGLHVRRWQALLPKFGLRATHQSRYGQIAVLYSAGEWGGSYSFYHDGALVGTWPHPDTPATDERNAALFALAQHPNPKRILVVGGTSGPFPTELQLLSGGEVVAVELDPALLQLPVHLWFGTMVTGKAIEWERRNACHTELVSGAEFERVAAAQAREAVRKRLLFVAEDARRAIQRLGAAGSRFDLIIVQLPAPLSAFVNRYFTVEFFREARAALNDDGVLMTSVMAAANYQGETVRQLSASVLRTLEAVFPDVQVAPGDTHTFLASTRPGLASLDPAKLARRVAARGIVLPDMDPAYRDALEPYYTALFENLILTSQVASLRQTLDATPAPIDTDARPIVYQYALRVWNQMVSTDLAARDPGLHSGTNALFRAALGLRFWHALAIPAALLAPALVLLAWRRVRKARKRVILSDSEGPFRGGNRGYEVRSVAADSSPERSFASPAGAGSAQDDRRGGSAAAEEHGSGSGHQTDGLEPALQTDGCDSGSGRASGVTPPSRRLDRGALL